VTSATDRRSIEAAIRTACAEVLRDRARLDDAVCQAASTILDALGAGSRCDNVTSAGGRPAIDDTAALAAMADIGGRKAVAVVARRLTPDPRALHATMQRLRQKRRDELRRKPG
jgi:hypothetical protein